MVKWFRYFAIGPHTQYLHILYVTLLHFAVQINKILPQNTGRHPTPNPVGTLNQLFCLQSLLSGLLSCKKKVSKRKKNLHTSTNPLVQVNQWNKSYKNYENLSLVFFCFPSCCSLSHFAEHMNQNFGFSGSCCLFFSHPCFACFWSVECYNYARNRQHGCPES